MDEKPFWVSHNDLPHSDLTGMMVKIPGLTPNKAFNHHFLSTLL